MAAEPPAKRPRMQKTGDGWAAGSAGMDIGAMLTDWGMAHGINTADWDMIKGVEIADGNMLMVDTRVSVMKGHMVSLDIGGSDPITQRLWGLALVHNLAAEGLLKGFDPAIHEIVVPHTTFQEGTDIYTPNAGSHLTILLHKDNPIPENAEQLVGGRTHRLGIDLNSIQFFLGRPSNDKAVRALYYVAFTVCAESQTFARGIQQELNVETIKDYSAHVSLAAIAPKGSRELKDIKKLRAVWAPEYPEVGYPPKITELKRWRCHDCGAPLQ